MEKFENNSKLEIAYFKSKISNFQYFFPLRNRKWEFFFNSFSLNKMSSHQTQSSSCCQKILESSKQSGIISHGALSVSHQEAELFRVSTLKDSDSLFDLASLTKVISGLTLFLIGKNKGLWNEESLVGNLLPHAGNNVKDLSLKELFSHESGLPAWRDYYPFSGREEIFASVLAENTGEEKPLYSDLGFLLLTHIMENKTGKRVDQLWEEWGLQKEWDGLRYPGNFAPYSSEARILPTKNTFQHRKGLLRGEVNDDNCFRMDSASLHAGLFGNLTSVRNWFWALKTGGIAPVELVRQTLSMGNSEFYLGWMKKTGDSSNAGTKFSKSSYGMLGFTGSSFFFDPERELLAVFLAHRENPTHDFTQIRKLRREIYGQMAEEFDKG